MGMADDELVKRYTSNCRTIKQLYKSCCWLFGTDRHSFQYFLVHYFSSDLRLVRNLFGTRLRTGFRLTPSSECCRSWSYHIQRLHHQMAHKQESQTITHICLVHTYIFEFFTVSCYLLHYRFPPPTGGGSYTWRYGFPWFRISKR